MIGPNNFILEEMRRVLEKVSAVGPNSKEQPLKVTTLFGRTYEVRHVVQIVDNVWVSNNDIYSQEKVACLKCSGFSNGGWMEISLKNGTTTMPSVRLFQPIHLAFIHPEELERLSTKKKCKAVFGSVINQISDSDNQINIIHWDLKTALEKAKSFVDNNKFIEHKSLTRYSMPYSIDRDRLFSMISLVLEDQNFQQNPNEIVREMKKNREVLQKVSFLNDPLLQFLEMYLQNLQNLQAISSVKAND